MVKGIRGYCSRSDNQAAGDRALGAIGRTVHDFNRIFAFLSCGKCCRPTAVEVDRHNAALLQHNLGKLVHSSATGKWLLTAIYHSHNYLAVRRYANHCA